MSEVITKTMLTEVWYTKILDFEQMGYLRFEFLIIIKAWLVQIEFVMLLCDNFVEYEYCYS